jgi:imidazole glycerol-phosphate synthase subunit HisH
MKVGIVDYGVGNLGSVGRALEELRVSPRLVDRATDLHHMDCLILPGVGNFADCIAILRKGGWVDALKEEVIGYGRPLLGVCLGMQLLADESMEGGECEVTEGVRGLGLVPGRVEHLSVLGCRLRVPHVGWNSVTPVPMTSGLFDGIPTDTDFYFVHSYAFKPTDLADVIATTEYGVTVTAAVRRGHVWGTQFHPEKSSRAGFRLMQNFLAGSAC